MTVGSRQLSEQGTCQPTHMPVPRDSSNASGARRVHASSDLRLLECPS